MTVGFLSDIFEFGMLNFSNHAARTVLTQ